MTKNDLTNTLKKLEKALKSLGSQLDNFYASQLQEAPAPGPPKEDGSAKPFIARTISKLNRAIDHVQHNGLERHVTTYVKRVKSFIHSQKWARDLEKKLNAFVHGKMRFLYTGQAGRRLENFYQVFQSFCDFHSLWLLEVPRTEEECLFNHHGFASREEAQAFLKLALPLMQAGSEAASSTQPEGRLEPHVTYCPDTSRDWDTYGPFFHHFSYRSLLILPLHLPADKTAGSDVFIGLNSKQPDAFSEKDIKFIYTMANLFYSQESITQLLSFSSGFLVSTLYNLPLGILGITKDNRLMIINHAVYDLLAIADDGNGTESAALLRNDCFPIETLLPKAAGIGLYKAIKDIRQHQKNKAMLRFWFDRPDGKRVFIKALIYPMHIPDSMDYQRQEARELDLFMILEDVSREYEQFTLQRSLEIARTVQQSFLPSSNFTNDQVVTYGVYQPAREIGGDYYDVMLHRNTLHIAIADVSGKGISASMVMASLKASLETLIDMEVDIGRTVKQINQIMLKNTPRKMFITLFYGRLNLATRELAYCNLGHTYPIWLKRDGSREYLKSTGYIIGMFPDLTCEVHRLRMEPGDMLFGYTDGITEAVNLDNRYFGEERLVRVLDELVDPSARQVVEEVIAAVSRFQGKAPQADDIAALALRIRPLNPATADPD